MPIPSPETISGYEKLGIIGILLLVLIVGLIVIVWAVKQLREVATNFFNFVTHQTKVLAEFKSAHEQQQDTQLTLHERLDDLFSCTRQGCPVFEMRKKQQKQAYKSALTQQDFPSSPPTATSS